MLLVCAFLILVISVNNSIINCCAQENLIVEHFFSHELVYNTEKAFCLGNSLRNCFDEDHITTTEFKNILEELFENNYCLVNLEDVYENINGRLVQKGKLSFNGKKPIILSFDDLSYDTKNRGIVEKIVVKDYELWDFSSCEETQFSQERDCLTILEKFIEKNPTFSFNGARATLCVTGYNGAFGYRVFDGTYLSGKELEEEKQELSNLISFLKQKGYVFACHSYGHCNCVYTNSEIFEQDIKKWKNEIGKYVGKTNIYCFPGGIHKAGNKNCELLKQNGFNVFLCVGKQPTQKEIDEENVTYLYRHPLDGKRLRSCEQEYAVFFDTKKVYDKTRFFSYT